jgi:predicted RNase H-like nuclease (RuvC/YqgF family)
MNNDYIKMLQHANIKIAELEKENTSLDDQNKRVCTEIAELEKRLSNAETMGDKAQSIRALEQQAKGVYDVRATTGFWNLSTCLLRTHLREYEIILKNQAKALKEQGK